MPDHHQTPRLQPFALLSFWRLGGLSFRRLVVNSIAGYHHHHLNARCAQFAYYSLLALAPLFILIIAAVAQLPVEGVLDTFLAAIDAGLPESAVALINRQIGDVRETTQLSLVAGGLLLLGVAGSRVFLTLGAGLDAAFGVKTRRHFLKAGGLALALTLGVFLLLLAAMVLLVVGPLATQYITGRVDIPWVHLVLSTGVRWGIACGFMLVAASVIYWLVPSVAVPWSWFSPGSVFATTGWVLVTQALRLYVENASRYNETYGALSGVVVLMIWLYSTGAMLLMGGEINGAIYRAARESDGG